MTRKEKLKIARSKDIDYVLMIFDVTDEVTMMYGFGTYPPSLNNIKDALKEIAASPGNDFHKKTIKDYHMLVVRVGDLTNHELEFLFNKDNGGIIK